MVYTLHTFAILKEKLGNPLLINTEREYTVEEMHLYLQQLYPEYSNLIRIARLSVNRSLAEGDHLIYTHDELCILPPFSGG